MRSTIVSVLTLCSSLACAASIPTERLFAMDPVCELKPGIYEGTGASGDAMSLTLDDDRRIAALRIVFRSDQGAPLMLGGTGEGKQPFGIGSACGIDFVVVLFSDYWRSGSFYLLGRIAVSDSTVSGQTPQPAGGRITVSLETTNQPFLVNSANSDSGAVSVQAARSVGDKMVFLLDRVSAN